MVAWGTSCGWIMPEPLQRAAMRISPGAPLAVAQSKRLKAVFSTVSVVRMAWATW